MNASDARYVLERLDADHVRGVAEQAKSAWEAGIEAFEVGYMPGDGTHYGLLFTILRPGVPVLSAPGGGSMGSRACTATGSRFDGTVAVVTYLQRGRSFVLGNRDFAHPSWLQAQIGADFSEASTLALAVLLNEITGASPGWESRYVDSLGD